MVYEVFFPLIGSLHLLVAVTFSELCVTSSSNQQVGSCNSTFVLFIHIIYIIGPLAKYHKNLRKYLHVWVDSFPVLHGSSLRHFNLHKMCQLDSALKGVAVTIPSHSYFSSTQVSTPPHLSSPPHVCTTSHQTTPNHHTRPQ